MVVTTTIINMITAYEKEKRGEKKVELLYYY
jgi:hypothetical protein